MNRKEGENWISPLHKQVYEELFAHGLAHSFEVWREGRLVAGLFGVLVGNIFRIKWQIDQGLTFMDTMEGSSKLMRAWGSYGIEREEFSKRVRAAQSMQ